MTQASLFSKVVFLVDRINSLVGVFESVALDADIESGLVCQSTFRIFTSFVVGLV